MYRLEFGFLLLFSCIVYFVYFTNYFHVCIFVYLLSINFVRILIVYFQNIVYSCIAINFTVSYVKIAHIYYIPCPWNYSIYFWYFIWICMYLCCLFHIFKCEYRYSIICGPWPKFFKGGRQNQVMKILLITGIICNFISIQSLTFWIFKT